jgi:acyl CoA:acetate/3-ketoacid CoA transferase beta subunit/acyl CoA:acetate/3-ketoacid CoA transferase alpha subunit
MCAYVISFQPLHTISPATVAAMASKVVSLDEAVAHVRAHDAVHIVTNHSRWTAAARHLARAWWGKDPGWTLVMLSLSSLGTLFFRGRLVRKVVTGYSGDVFPNFTPNPWFGDAYLSGAVEVEHWSFLTFLQRLEAAARGLPALVTASLDGSSMAANPGYARVTTPFGEAGLVQAYAPDVALLHAPVADPDGNVAFNAPMLEGVWGALASKRGAIVTVERVVDDIRPWSHLVRVPAHRVLAVAEAPMGAHPGGLFARDVPCDAYGEDLAFWSEARDASRAAPDAFDEWIERWVLAPADQHAYLDRLGAQRVAALRARAATDSWKADERAHPPDLAAPAGAWERAAVHGARYLAQRIVARKADAVLAGAGVANLAAWLAVHRAREEGSAVVLTAELGMLGYEPTPADPFVFNHRSFPSATMLGDSDQVLGVLSGGPGTRLLACLGAAQIDLYGNINSTVVPGKAFLVGSGGGNDVASTADEVVVMATLTPRRTVPSVPYVTSPGRRVRAFVTDLGTFEKDPEGRLVLTAVAAGDASVEARVALVREACGWEVLVAPRVAELPPPDPADIELLRRWDPTGLFLRGG